MQILSHSHREKLLLEWQKEHRWGTHAEVGPIRDSVGQRLGVLGYGSIGRQGEFLSPSCDGGVNNGFGSGSCGQGAGNGCCCLYGLTAQNRGE